MIDVSPTELSTPSSPTKDKDYFFEDGDYIIQAGDYLFKIHQFLLKRDSQIFKDLFSLPQPVPQHQDSQASNDSGEGKCEERPLVFQDSADDFRALCWALYARPSDILDQQNSATIDVVRMTRLLVISHKYEIGHFWDWALRVIKDNLTSIPGKLITSSGGSWESAERLLNLSNHSPDAAFISQRIEAEWLRIIQSSNPSDARAVFMAALDAAERSPSLRRFHGNVYHTYMKAIGLPRTSTSESIDMSHPETLIDSSSSELGEPRTSRLCRGYWSLSQLRSKLGVAPKINENPLCANHASQCVAVWNAWWTQSLQTPNQSPQIQQIQEPRELIAAMYSRATSLGLGYNPYYGYNSSHVPCNAAILEQLKDMLENFDSTLADHFMVPRE